MSQPNHPSPRLLSPRSKLTAMPTRTVAAPRAGNANASGRGRCERKAMPLTVPDRSPARHPLADHFR